ncbi:MAG: dual specificity protein phosphatase [Thermodesulfobacteriota bacterium]
MTYQLTWITTYLAVGSAPMSYDDLDAIRAQGINAIVNLCGEFCDLHEIEEQSGFEVYFFPIPDENAPDMAAMEQALAWLDEAVYLGKKVLVHCRHGIGRTGTFVTAYLLRRGLGLKVAGKKMAHSRATPANYAQWRLLKRYGKQSGTLTVREPSLENRHVVELADFFAEYQGVMGEMEEQCAAWLAAHDDTGRCGREHDRCCRRHVALSMAEAVCLAHHLNRSLASGVRQECVERAVAASQRIRAAVRNSEVQGDDIQQVYTATGFLCPLSAGGRCLLYEFRPLACRSFGVPPVAYDAPLVADILANVSRNIFFALSGQFLGDEGLAFPMVDVVSGRFTQIYFHYLAAR